MSNTLTRNFSMAGFNIEIRPMTKADAPNVIEFIRHLPPHDLLFVQRDIRNEKVLQAWFDNAEIGEIPSMVATNGKSILATAALIRDPLSWSAHVGEVRVLVGQGSRGTGLGRMLADGCIDLAAKLKLEKLVVRMTPDQVNARKLFVELGFKQEAVLRRQVIDVGGAAHDIVILAIDLLRARA